MVRQLDWRSDVETSKSQLNAVADVIYVIHAFQKKMRRAAKRDVDLAASRLREQMVRMR
jgi:phage-related protein